MNFVTTQDFKDALKGKGFSEVTQKDLEQFQGKKPCKNVITVIESKGLHWPEAEKQIMTA